MQIEYDFSKYNSNFETLRRKIYRHPNFRDVVCTLTFFLLLYSFT